MYMDEREEDTTGRPRNRYRELSLRIVLLIVFIVSGPLTAIASYSFEEPDRILKILLSEEDNALVQDFIDFFTSVKACRQLRVQDCIEKTDNFFTAYPDSYLKDDLLRVRIETFLKAIIEKNLLIREAFLAEAENYLSLFPDDEEILFLYAEVLKKKGEDKKYTDILKRIYLKGQRYFSHLKRVFSPEEFSQDEILLLVNRLMKQRRYQDAEEIVISFIVSKKSRDIIPLYKSLADLNYKRRNYRKAAFYYYRAVMEYEAARAFYRADRQKEFDKILKKLRNVKDEKTCRLLILKGQTLRRSGDFDGALRIFRRLYRGGYPCREASLWFIAWTEYLQGNFLSASYNFRTLYRRHKDDRYLYWLIRALEHLGKDPDPLVGELSKDSFYSILLHYDKGDRISLKVASIDYQLQDEIYRLPRRIQILKKAGLREYALREAMDYEGPQQCMILKELGSWVRAIRCAEDNRVLPLIYPLAYGDIIKEVAKETELDPFLLLALIRQESMFQKDAVSIAGAMGLMQLMPATAKTVAKKEGIRLNSHRELFHPEINIRLGAVYLKKLIEEFQSLPVALAAYNAGEHRVKTWLNSYSYRAMDEFIEDIPFAETRNYTKKVIFNYFQYRTLYSPF